jgi:hypothetical protein
MTRVSIPVPVPVMCCPRMRPVGTGVVARLRGRGARRRRVAVSAGVARRNASVTRWEMCETRRDTSVSGRDAPMTRRRRGRPAWVVARGGNALESPDEAEGHPDEKNSFTPLDLCAPSDRGVLR